MRLGWTLKSCLQRYSTSVLFDRERLHMIVLAHHLKREKPQIDFLLCNRFQDVQPNYPGHKDPTVKLRRCRTVFT